MSLRYGILGLFLGVVFILLIFKNYETWNQPIEPLSGKEEVKKQDKKSETQPSPKEQKETTPIKTYISVAEKNVFSPERKEFPVMISPGMAGETKKPLVRPQIVLYGVTLVGDYQSATVSNPGRPLRKGEKETMTLKVGGAVGEYKVAKILSDRVMMESGEDSFEVLLYDTKSPKKRTHVKTEIKPATVASATPSPAPAAPAPAPSGPERVAPSPPSAPAAPISPLPPARRGRTPLSPSPDSPTPMTPSTTPSGPMPSAPTPMTPPAPIPMAPPTRIPIPMAPPTPIPLTPPAPGAPGSGGQ